MQQQNDDNAPLLSKFAVERNEENPLPGYYEEARQVWVVETSTGIKPIVEARTQLAEISTKTDVRQEEDDAPTTYNILEFETKTMVRQESDD